MSNNRKQIEIWDLPKKAFSIGSGQDTYRSYCVKQVRNDTTTIYAWIPDYQLDMITAITNPQAKGCKYIGIADANFQLETLTSKLEIPTIEEIDNLYNNQITAEQVNGLTNEELLAKYQPSELAEVIVKLSLQNEYYSMLINAIKKEPVNDKSDDKKPTSFINQYYNKIKDDWEQSNTHMTFNEYLNKLLDEAPSGIHTEYLLQCKAMYNEQSDADAETKSTKRKARTKPTVQTPPNIVSGNTTTITTSGSTFSTKTSGLNYRVNNVTSNTLSEVKPLIQDNANDSVEF